ncbi:MAG: NAD-dependent epimerase/dehydratase family protein [Actinomycetes bacterium]|jgi:nucleoside-diphosphate-sugar epimerase|nr:MAG: NAD-dependent epimerase [Actinomycetota bacterium]
MRVVVVGGTGNIGTSVISALAADPAVTSILGVARRRPDWHPDKTEWATADVAVDDLAPLFAGADAVVHLAWLFQPTHNPRITWRTNVIGTSRVLDAVARAKVPALVYSSSVGAYSPRPQDDRPVTEDWPTNGWPTASYAVEKAYVERLLDIFERDHGGVRVVRMRPGFMFKRASAAEQMRLFGGPLVPRRLVRPGRIPVVPDIPGLRFQALHSDDAGEAYRLAVTRDVSGAFNLAADPVIHMSDMARLLGARLVPVPRPVARGVLAAAWGARLVPASHHMLDMALHLPLLDVARARTELGWTPRHSGLDALRELIEGLTTGSGGATPPLEATKRPGLRPGVGARP